MVYVGGKSRHAKHIIPILNAHREDGQTYMEPFVGGFNIMSKMTGSRMANDSHWYLIALFQAIQSGWTPPESIAEEEYIRVRDNQTQFPDHYVGWVGFGATYSGKWFGGYARGKKPDGTPRDYVAERQRNIMKQAESLTGIKITCYDYQKIQIPPKSLIYCDPPYKGTLGYKSQSKKQNFNSPIFWLWAETMATKGHTVFVSEYEAPPTWTSVWEKTVNNTINQNTGEKQGTEKLFTIP